MHFLNGIFFWKVDFFNTVEAKVIFLTWYVETKEAMLKVMVDI